MFLNIYDSFVHNGKQIKYVSNTSLKEKRMEGKFFLSTYFAGVYELDVFNPCNILKKTYEHFIIDKYTEAQGV